MVEEEQESQFDGHATQVPLRRLYCAEQVVQVVTEEQLSQFVGHCTHCRITVSV